MIRKAIVAAIEMIVIALAAYAFFFLPVGTLTPWGHLRAIFSTPPAHQAAQDMVQATHDLQEKLTEKLPKPEEKLVEKTKKRTKKKVNTKYETNPKTKSNK